MDRGYLDFARLYNLTLCLAFFVIRSKTNLKFRRIYSHPIDKSLGLICDQTIVLSNADTAKDYPQKLRRVGYYDTENQKKLIFLSNNSLLCPLLPLLLFTNLDGRLNYFSSG
jgi:hypothetical protein